MTKKDFELIAKILAQHIWDRAKCFDSLEDCRAIAESFAEALATTNKNFDQNKFLKACGVSKFPRY